MAFRLWSDYGRRLYADWDRIPFFFFASREYPGDAVHMHRLILAVQLVQYHNMLAHYAGSVLTLTWDLLHAAKSVFNCGYQTLPAADPHIDKLKDAHFFN